MDEMEEDTIPTENKIYRSEMCERLNALIFPSDCIVY